MSETNNELKLVEIARTQRPQIVEASQFLNEAKSQTGIQLFDEWKPGVAYAADYKVKYDKVQYKVQQAHTSQVGWEPNAAPSLFARVLIPDPSVIPEWVQPDSTNPYMIGDKVTHGGHTWACTVDNNVWEPGVYGWTQID